MGSEFLPRGSKSSFGSLLQTQVSSLAYVQHPFPAQGHTTDTTHLIVSEHTTSEGAYVAITRARHQTHIYASHQRLDIDPTDAYLEPLAQRMGRAEPDIPSIRYPLAHETHVHHAHPQEHDTSGPGTGPDARPTPNYHQRRSTYRTSAAQHPVAVHGPWRSSPRDILTRWRDADAIERYPTRQRIDPPERAAPTSPLAVPTFSQRYERRQAGDAVLEGLARLDPGDPSTNSIQERALQRLGLSRHNQQADRSAGWEL